MPRLFLARSRVHADPRLSPRLNIVILSISAQRCETGTMQSVGQHRERRKLGQRAFENCDMLKHSFLYTLNIYDNISLIKKLECLSICYTEI